MDITTAFVRSQRIVDRPDELQEKRVVSTPITTAEMPRAIDEVQRLKDRYGDPRLTAMRIWMGVPKYEAFFKIIMGAGGSKRERRKPHE